MNIVEYKLTDLVLPDYNPRMDLKPGDKAYEQIKNSIDKFGYVDPVIVNKRNNVIISGNQRYKVMKDLGYNKIKCVEVDFDNKNEKALNIAINKIDGEWDEEKLNVMLSELQDINFDMKFTGFDEAEIGKMLAENKKCEDDNFDEDEAKKEAKNTKLKPGLYQLGNNFVLCGDATKKKDVEKLLMNNKPESFLVFTDPPYGINIVGKDKQIGRTKVAKAKKYKEVIGDNTIETAKKFYDNIIDIGFDKYIIWGGNNFLSFLPSDSSWICWDKRGDIAPNDFGDGELGYSSLHHPIRIYKHVWSGMIQEGKREERVHPTQKPVAMLFNVVKSFLGKKEKFDNVIDMFGGSGSTLIACEQLNIPCFVMELDIEYCDVIINRYIKFKGNDNDVFLIEKSKKTPWSKLNASS